jgi:hypothetical protein
MLLNVDQPDLKIARMNVNSRDGRLAIVDFHYLVGTPEGVEYFTERHEFGLFTENEYRAALNQAGLSVDYDPDGLTGRGLYIATKQTLTRPRQRDRPRIVGGFRRSSQQ